MSVTPFDSRTIGILAGQGLYPHLLADRIAKAGCDVVVAGLKGQYEHRPATPARALRVFPIGTLGAIADFFKTHGAGGCIMAGGVNRTGVLRHVRLDRHALTLLPRVFASGDNALLAAVAAKLTRLGIPVLDADPFLGDLLAPEGLLAGPSVDEATLADLRVAWKAARTLGARDRGQTAIARDGRVIGLETRGGTDALIAGITRSGAVLAKTVKPGQDARFDMPAIGPGTALLATTKGLRAIAIQANAVLLLDRDRLLSICQKQGISLLSVPAEGP